MKKIIPNIRTEKINFLGNMRGQNQGFVGSVYGLNGISPTIRARDYKEPVLIMVVYKNG